jgi:alkaline phosphatase D
LAEPKFLHGIASGDPLPQGVTLWTHVTACDNRVVELQWLVAYDAELRNAVRGGQVTARPERDWTVAVDVDGLSPSTGAARPTARPRSSRR